jgi:hypothetical protein
MSALSTLRNKWLYHRELRGGGDFPTDAAKNAYNPITTGADRQVDRMLDYNEAEVAPIDLRGQDGANALQLRFGFDDSSITATTAMVFACREGEDSVVPVCLLTWVANNESTQFLNTEDLKVNGFEDTFYSLTSYTVTSYWPKEILESPVESAGSLGIKTISFDTMGYDRFWVFSTGNAGGGISCEWSSF